MGERRLHISTPSQHKGNITALKIVSRHSAAHADFCIQLLPGSSLLVSRFSLRFSSLLTLRRHPALPFALGGACTAGTEGTAPSARGNSVHASGRCSHSIDTVLPHITHGGDRQTPPQRKSLRFFSSFANVAAASTLPCKSGFGAQEPRLDASLRSWTQQSREQTGGNRNCARQTPRRCEFVEDTVAPPQR